MSWIAWGIISGCSLSTMAKPDSNTDESKVPSYELPAVLETLDGTKIDTAADWEAIRRPEILELFRANMYGRKPAEARLPKVDRVGILEQATEALGGQVRRMQFRIHFDSSAARPYVDVLVYLPKEAQSPVPAFLGYNFHGNQTVRDDKDILLPDTWVPSRGTGVINNRPTDASRGSRSSRWEVESICDRGFALVTAYCGDIDPDTDDGFKNGVHALLAPDADTGGPESDGDNWASIATWAWGLSTIRECLAEIPEIDETCVVAFGHSRLGKTALWAGAIDQGFAGVISNNSGCGGAALSRREFGERVEAINRNFPHWFCNRFKEFNGRESELPIDQHMLAALIAPRPLYIASASEDLWADPRGEFLSLKGALPVYQLYDQSLTDRGLEFVEPGESVGQGHLRYHLRPGKHDVTDFDWQRYINFARMNVQAKE